jgi:hypothetical protein
MERQSGTPSAISDAYTRQLKNALERAGLRRNGAPGDSVPFDQSLHEFWELPPEAFQNLVVLE